MLKAKAKKAGRRITVGEDKAYDTADHVANLRALNVTPHVVQNDSIPQPASAGRAPSPDARRGTHNQPVAPRVRRQKDRTSATLHVLRRTARAVSD
jgi:hypothetical protein